MQTELNIHGSKKVHSKEHEVREFLWKIEQLIAGRDAEGLMEHFEENYSSYDVAPPFESHGVEAGRESYKIWFDGYPEVFHFKFVEPHITISGHLAVVNTLCHIQGMRVDFGPVDNHIRSTMVLRDFGGEWKLIHEHNSMPVDMRTQTAVPHLDGH